MNAHCAVDFADGLERWDVAPKGKSKDLGSWSFARYDRLAAKRPITMPGVTYSRRSAHLAKLRAESQLAAAQGEDDFVPPTAAAMASAEGLINSLFEGCLDFSLALSHDGEINFLYGDDRELFHIHIDEEGSISFYAKRTEGELLVSDLDPAKFPHAELLKFADRRK